MGKFLNTIQKQMHTLGADRCAVLPVKSLVLDETVRDACVCNRCGQYGVNYMCPPHIGSFDAIRKRLNRYDRGVLFQKEYAIADTKSIEAVAWTKIDFHELLLEAEAFLEANGITAHWGMVGGHCIICSPCKVVEERPCPHPELARNSLESIGVQVLSLAKSLGLDHEFHDDKIVWTGGLLWLAPSP